MAFRRRNNDWSCTSCNFNNFGKRRSCKNCGAAKPGGGRRSSGGGGRVSDPSNNRKPGDWICPSCGVNNFRSRDRCFKCRTNKPQADAAQNTDEVQARRERRGRQGSDQDRRGRGRGRGGRDRDDQKEGDPAPMEVDEKDYSRVEFARGSFAALAAGGTVESIEINTESEAQSVRLEWHTGPSTGKANAFFREDGSALMAVEILRRTRMGSGHVQAEDPQPCEHKGENVFKVHMRGVPLDFDDEALMRALDGMGVQDLVEAFIFRREPTVAPQTDLVIVTIKSLFDKFGLIRLKSHPPRFGTAAAILDFPDTESCLAAIGEVNNTPSSFGVGKLKVKLDLRCTVATQQNVWDVLERDITDLMFTIRRDRVQFPSVKIFLFGRERSATGVSRAVVCGSDPSAVCKARELYNDLLRPLVLYMENDAIVGFILTHLNKHIRENTIPRVFIRASPATGTIRIFATPETRQTLNELSQGLLQSMFTESLVTNARSVRLLLTSADYTNWNTGNNEFEVFVTGNLSHSSIEIVGTNEENVRAAVANLEATFVANDDGNVEMKNGEGTDENLCGVCFMEIEPGEESVNLNGCGHVFHSECLMHQCKSSLGVSGTRPLTCARCQAPIELTEISKFLSPDEMTDFSKLCARDFLQTHPGDYKQCPTPDCNQIYPANGTGLFNCSECLRQYCMSCRTADGSLSQFHVGMSCENYQRSKDADATFAEFMKTYASETMSKKCPHCHTLTDKFTNTCNHATCVYCKTHFCWKCLWIPSDRSSGQAVYAHMRRAHGGWYG